MKTIPLQQAARFSTALILAIGLFAILAISGIWMVSIANALLRRMPPDGAYEGLFVEPDGTPVIVKFTYPKRQYRTVDNAPATPASESQWMQGAFFQRENPIWNPAGWLERVNGFADDAAPPGYWYFFVDADNLSDGQWRGYYVGFDSATGRKIGYIGMSGFTQELPSANDQFLSRPEYPIAVLDVEAKSTPLVLSELGHIQRPPWVQFVLSDRRFVKLDLAARSLDTVVSARDILDWNSVATPDTSHPDLLKRSAAPYNITFALLRPDRITHFDPRDERATDFVLPAELRNASFTFYPASKESALAIQSQFLRSGAQVHELTWFSAKGETTRRETLRLNDALSAESTLQKVIDWAILSATPPAILPIGYAVQYMEGGREGFRETILASWPIIVGSVLLGIAFSVLANRWRTRNDLRYSFGWLAFVFLFGLPGYIGYRLHRRWPIREQAPPPVLTGVEIFA